VKSINEAMKQWKWYHYIVLFVAIYGAVKLFKSALVFLLVQPWLVPWVGDTFGLGGVAIVMQLAKLLH
jgi:hypothetical protein